MKNKFFVSIEIVIALLFLWVCGFIGFIWFALDAFGEDIILTIILTIMLLVLPTVLLICGTYVFAAQIQINENGITKKLFGLRQKFFHWEEIDHVKFNGTVIASTILFYKKRKGNSLVKRYSQYDKIYFYLDEQKLAIVEFYAPDYIKEMIQNKPLK